MVLYSHPPRYRELAKSTKNKTVRSGSIDSGTGKASTAPVLRGSMGASGVGVGKMGGSLPSVPQRDTRYSGELAKVDTSPLSSLGSSLSSFDHFGQQASVGYLREALPTPYQSDGYGCSSRQSVAAAPAALGYSAYPAAGTCTCNCLCLLCLR